MVNFNYLIRIMENYGFRPVTDEEAKGLRLPSGIGNFKLLFDKLIEDKKRNPSIEKFIGKALKMSIEEKKISYYNNYFVFVKIANPEFSVEDELNPQNIENPPTIQEKSKPPTTELTFRIGEPEKKTVAKKKGRKIKLVKKEST